MTNNIKAIKKLEDKYGLILFRMALTHLMDVGIRNLTDEAIRETIAQIREEEAADVNRNRIPIMTAGFQCEIVHCASELAKIDIWDLFHYIKEYVHVENN